MDVNQVKFGNYAIGNGNSGAKKSEGKKEDAAQENLAPAQAQTVDANSVFDAMAVQGLQNKAQINFAAKKELDPVAFLGEERVADIEAMMARFENGVKNVSSTIDSEFPGAFSEADKNALAAHIYAQL